MDVRREVAHCGGDARIQRTSVGEVPTETHAGCADAAGAGGEGEEEGDGEGGVFVVGGEGFGYLGGVKGVEGGGGRREEEGKGKGEIKEEDG